MAWLTLSFTVIELRVVRLPLRVYTTIRVFDACLHVPLGIFRLASSHEFLQGRVAHSRFRTRGINTFSELARHKTESELNPTRRLFFSALPTSCSGANRLCQRCHLFPRFFAQEHHPTTHQQFAGDRHDRLFPARFLPPAQTFVLHPRPGIAPEQGPSWPRLAARPQSEQ